jgi:hypothetical protein
MYDRVWQIPTGQFVAVWNGSASVAEAAERLRAIAGGGPIPRWAVQARAATLRKEGADLKVFAKAA